MGLTLPIDHVTEKNTKKVGLCKICRFFESFPATRITNNNTTHSLPKTLTQLIPTFFMQVKGITQSQVLPGNHSQAKKKKKCISQYVTISAQEYSLWNSESISSEHVTKTRLPSWIPKLPIDSRSRYARARDRTAKEKRGCNTRWKFKGDSFQGGFDRCGRVGTNIRERGIDLQSPKPNPTRPLHRQKLFYFVISKTATGHADFRVPLPAFILQSDRVPTPAMITFAPWWSHGSRVSQTLRIRRGAPETAEKLHHSVCNGLVSRRNKIATVEPIKITRQSRGRCLARRHRFLTRGRVVLFRVSTWWGVRSDETVCLI